MPFRITIRHIAEELNLTPATVSRALHNHPRISAETKELVHETARRLNYRKNRIASSTRTGKTHTVGVIIPSARMNFFGSVVHGIETVASEHGYHTLIYQSEESLRLEVNAIEAFLGARVDGIIVSPAKEDGDLEHFRELIDMNLPFVLFDRLNESLNVSSVVIDDYKGGYIATEHLIQQGYTRIAHLAGPQQFQTFHNRQRGYLDALRAYNMTIDESLIVVGDLSIETGKKATDYFMELSETPDAIFAVEDFSALGLIKRLKEREVKIPKEMGVIGFANEEFDEHITPSLSSIDQQTVLMGSESFRLLLNIIEGNRAGIVTEVTRKVLDPIPFFRESTRRGKMLNGSGRPIESQLTTGSNSKT